MVNKLKKFRELELMCKSLVNVISLHRRGLEDYNSVLMRANMLSQYIDKLLEMGKDSHKEDKNI